MSDLDNPTISAALYIRVSLEEQRFGNSLQTQTEDGSALIERLQKQRLPVYQDIESGQEENRESYRRLLRDAERGLFRVLVVWKVDRFTRKTRTGLVDLMHLIDDLGIEFYSVMERIDTKTAEGRKNLRNLVSDAEYEVDRLKERVMPGMIRGVIKGHWQGAHYPPYGYFYDKPNKKLVEVEKEIEVVKVIYSLRASNMAIHSICLRLADMGIRNRVGRLFTTRQIDIILNRMLYFDGHLIWTDRRNKKEPRVIRSDAPAVTPFIDKETWEKVQAVNRERSHEAKSVSPGRVNSPYILQGVLKCMHCGGNMVGQLQISNRARKIKIPWYACGQRLQRTRKACLGQRVRADAAHDLAFGILKKVLQNPQLIQLTREHLKSLLEYSFPHLSRRIRELRSILQRLERDIVKCRDAYYKGAMTVEQFGSENHRLLKEREESEKELKEIEAKLSGAAAYQGKVDQVFELLKNFEPVWLKMAPVQQRVVYRGIFNHFYVESRKYSREYRVRDFSLKEPFESWYHNRTWEGPLLIQQEGQILSIKGDNTQQDKELCGKSTFAHLAAK